MKVKLLTVGAAVVVALLIGRGAASEKAAKQADSKLEGTWKVSSMEVFGKPIPEDKVSSGAITLTFKGNKVTKKEANGKDDEATYKVNTEEKPAQIEITPTKKGDKGQLKGIYEIKGNTLRMCFVPSAGGGPEGKELSRPTEFDSTKAILITLKRQ